MKVVIVGAGELGYHLAERLSLEQIDVVLIEQDPRKVRHLLEHFDIQVIRGSGSSPEVLKRAGIEEADMLVAVTNSDEVNVVACLIAAAQSRTPKKIARIREPSLFNHSRIFGQDFLNVDYAINPEAEVVSLIDRLLDIPGATDLAYFAGGKILAAGFKVGKDAPLIGPTLEEFWANGTTKTKLLLAAIHRDDRVIIPTGKHRVMPGDTVFVIHQTDRVHEVYPLLGLHAEPVRMVMIAGGSRMGVDLARLLEKKNLTVKLIEPDLSICQKTSDELEHTLVLHADPHDRDMLLQEHVDKADIFIAAGTQDDTNVMISLLVHKMGARRVITLVNQVHYIELVQAVGIDVALCPKLVAVSQIAQFIRRGRVLSVAAFGEDEAEALEVIALEGSGLTDEPLSTLKLPKGVIVGALVRRQEVIIPDGTSLIQPGDHVILFAPTASVPKLEKMLAKGHT